MPSSLPAHTNNLINASDNIIVNVVDSSAIEEIKTLLATYLKNLNGHKIKSRTVQANELYKYFCEQLGVNQSVNITLAHLDYLNKWQVMFLFLH